LRRDWSAFDRDEDDTLLGILTAGAKIAKVRSTDRAEW
jgi:hypothetical protein